MSDLFEASAQTPNNQSSQPLAESLRPKVLDQFIGQNQAEHKMQNILKNLKDKGFLPNLILWGPPGTGKTTWARLIGQVSQFEFLQVNAIETGAKEIREIGLKAHRSRIELQAKTILFIDEIHRLNRSQQDVLLPFTEKGDLYLIGATTENPSYELNSALLSRCQVIVFERLTATNLTQIMRRATKHLGFDFEAALSSDSISAVVEAADGDGRKFLNLLELIYQSFSSQTPLSEKISPADLQEILMQRTLRYDRVGESHYDNLSAFIKSLRGSDPDAAIYYLARMIKGGEDPVTIARRMVILASEDVGNADPKALPLAIAGLQAVEAIGLPEAGINLAQVVTYLASAPKSNRSYEAYNKALEIVEKTGTLEIPLHIRNAKTRLMKDLGYGRDYAYAHDYPKGHVAQTYLPDQIKNEKFYEPTELGFEKNIRQYLKWLKSDS
jgi:putative ATPase